MPKAKERDGVFQRKDRSGWFISYIDATGTRRKQKVTAYTRKQALTALAETKAKIEKEQRLGIKGDSDISVNDLFERFRRYQKPLVAQSTFERTDAILETLKEHLPQLAKAITKVVIADLISARLAKVGPATVSKEVTTLGHILRLAVDEWELLSRNTAHGVKLPKLPKGRTRYLSPAELKAALEAAPEWMRAPLALAAFTGMRRGEILKLRWMDIDLKGRLAYLHETKNGDLRVLPLNELAMQVIESLPQGKPEEPILRDVDSQRLSVYTRRVFKRLGITDASYHSLRHTFASWLVMKGADLYTAGKLLGHKTPRMTERYAHLAPGYLAGAAQRLDGVFGSVLAGPQLVPVESPLLTAAVASGD